MFRRQILRSIKPTTRGFYFKASGQRNIDFPLNVGYNDEYDLEPMALRSKMSLVYRKSRLNKQFISKYKDLLNAIKN